MSLDARAARLVVLVAWAGLFWWLRATGQVARFIGPRNFWVVTVAAVVLTALLVLSTLVGRHGAQAREREWLSLREGIGLALLLAPVLVVLVSSSAQLGSLAAANKLSNRGVDLSALPQPPPGQLTFLTIDVAQRHADYARANGIVPGKRVQMTGFVLGAATTPARPFRLARFYITCCVADAIVLDVTVQPPSGSRAGFRKDQWLQVDGRLRRRDGHLVVAAEQIRATPPPSNPYGTFSG